MARPKLVHLLQLAKAWATLVSIGVKLRNGPAATTSLHLHVGNIFHLRHTASSTALPALTLHPAHRISAFFSSSTHISASIHLFLLSSPPNFNTLIQSVANSSPTCLRLLSHPPPPLPTAPEIDPHLPATSTSTPWRPKLSLLTCVLKLRAAMAPTVLLSRDTMASHNPMW